MEKAAEGQWEVKERAAERSVKRAEGGAVGRAVDLVQRHRDEEPLAVHVDRRGLGTTPRAGVMDVHTVQMHTDALD